jgi:hypothetical protein
MTRQANVTEVIWIGFQITEISVFFIVYCENSPSGGGQKRLTEGNEDNEGPRKQRFRPLFLSLPSVKGPRGASIV